MTRPRIDPRWLAGAAAAMRRTRIGIAAAAVLVAACMGTSGPTNDDAPWKGSGDGEYVTSAPDAGGVLSFRNCPTLAEAAAAMPAITAGPDANAVPFKSMVLQCAYTLPGHDAEGHAAGIAILVFDAQFDGLTSWSWALDEGDWGAQTPIPGLGDEAFVTNRQGRWDMWVSAGRFGLHFLHNGPVEPALPEATALAQASIAGLERPPR